MSLRGKLSGVILDDQLRWNDYDEQSKKIDKGIALLRRAKFFVAKDTLTKMYKSLFCRISHTVRPYGMMETTRTSLNNKNELPG